MVSSGPLWSTFTVINHNLPSSGLKRSPSPSVTRALSYAFKGSFKRRVPNAGHTKVICNMITFTLPRTKVLPHNFMCTICHSTWLFLRELPISKNSWLLWLLRWHPSCHQHLYFGATGLKYLLYKRQDVLSPRHSVKYSVERFRSLSKYLRLWQILKRVNFFHLATVLPTDAPSPYWNTETCRCFSNAVRLQASELISVLILLKLQAN